MNEAILKLWAAQALAMPPYPNKNFPPSPYYRFLKVLAQNIHPKLSVELGVCGGGGSLHLAMGWFEGQVIGIDNQDDHRENIDYILNKYRNFNYRIGDSVDLSHEIKQHFGQVDILFIDTIHEYQRTWNEYNAWKPYLSDNAVVCFDDLFRPGMGDFWDELEGNKLRLDFLHDGAENGGGFGVWWK